MNNQPTYVQYQVVEPTSTFFQDLLQRCIRNWYWFVLSVVLALAGGYAYLTWKQPVYQIQAGLLIKENQKDSEQDKVLKEIPDLAPKKVLENEIEVLRSTLLMNRVVEKLNLSVHYFEKRALGEWEVFDESPITMTVIESTPTLYQEPLAISFPSEDTFQLNGQAYPLGKPVQTAYGKLLLTANRPLVSGQAVTIQVAPPEAEVIGWLKTLRVEQTAKNSSVLLLTLDDAVPKRGEAVLNQLIKEYNEATLSDKNELAASTLKFVDNRLQILSKELAQVEKEVESYKSTKGITDLSIQTETILKTAQANDAQLSEVNIRLAALNDLENYLSNRSENRGVTPATVGLNDQVLIGQIEKVAQLEQKRHELMQTTSDKNVLIQGLDEQIKVSKENIRGNIQTMKAMTLSSQRELALRNKQLEGSLRSIPQKERLLMDITRQQAIKSQLYTYMLQKREETAVAFAATLSDSRTINPPQRSLDPVKPKRMIIFGIFGLLGLLLPVTVLAGYETFNNRVRRRQDVEQKTTVPILGEVIRQHKANSLVVTAAHQTLIAEQIRMLRANLQRLHNNASQNLVLLTTSSISGEGKSFLTSNIGASMALVGFPTVLVDMDLRNPKLHRIFNQSNEWGVANYLLGECSLDDILRPIAGYENYYLLPSGSSTASPAELLCSPRLEVLFNELRQRFTYIVTDTPPVGITSDAQLLAPLADATLFVVRHNVTPRNCISIVNSLQEEKVFPHLTIVLNGVSEEESYRVSYSGQYRYYQPDARRKRQKNDPDSTEYSVPSYKN